MLFLKKILSSFKNKHLQSLIGTGFNAVIGMVIFAILYRALSKQDIGYYIVFTVVLNLIDTLKAGFVTNAFINFFSGVDEDRANDVSGSSWVLAIIITLILVAANGICYFLIPYVTNQSVVLVFTYFAIVSVSTLPSFMANLVVQGQKRFDRLLWLRLLGQLLFVAGIIGLMILHRATLNSVIIAFIISNGITSIATLLFGWTKISTTKYATKKTLIEIFHFGKYSFGSSLSSNLFSVTDTFFLSGFLGPGAIAVYALGGKLIQIVEIPLLSFKISSMPDMSAYYNKDQKYNVIFVTKKMIGMITLPIVFLAILSIIFAEPIIGIIGGRQYIHSEAPNLFRIFMTLAILYPTDRYFALALDVIHKPQINFYKILIMLAINLVADYIGVSIVKSVYSIVLTNIFPIAAAIIITYIPLNKYYKFNFWSMYKLGYTELVLFVKNTYSSLLGKEKTGENPV